MTDTHQPWNPPTESSQPPAPDPYAPVFGPLGQVRSTGTCILLFFVTLGIYGFVWLYATLKEIRVHTDQGIGGMFGSFTLYLYVFAAPFLTSSEVGKLYDNRGAPPPVSGKTGLWFVPGFLLLLIGPFVWFIKTNNALNGYWMRSAQSQPA